MLGWMTSCEGPTSVADSYQLPRSRGEAHEAASAFATAGDVDAVRRLISELEAAGEEDLADSVALYIETALSYKDHP